MSADEVVRRRREDILCRVAWTVGAVAVAFSLTVIVWAWADGALG